jgi:O-methyltransferase
VPGPTATSVGQSPVTASLRNCARALYVRFLRPHLASHLARQRVKVVWHAWGYAPLLRLRRVPMGARLTMIRRFLRVDWHVPHAHRPSEISAICQTLDASSPRHGEVVIEAGCWQGGSSAKFSIICKCLGYRLHIYDSFAGVEVMSDADRALSFDFSGTYNSPVEVLRRNLEQYGEPQVCSIHPGWFAATLATAPVTASVRLAYIDCDLAKGTKEALRGVIPALVEGGVVFSQDCHIPPVLQALTDPLTWTDLRREVPRIERLGPQLARISFLP